MKRQVIIIGGGASGLAAAIAAARTGAEVTILEHMDRVGKKILSTGNGRCNFTNLVMNADCYRSSQREFPMQVIGAFGVSETVEFFRELGIVPKDKNGYLYPNSEQAAAILDALRFETEHLGVRTVLGCHIKNMKKTGNGRFLVETAEQGKFQGDALILATGSKAAPVTGSDGSGYDYAKSFGHRIIRPLPALVQLKCQGKHFKQLAGIRCEAKVTLISDGNVLASDRGEVQLTDYGISGIPTFQVSRFASVALSQGKNVTAALDFLPSMNLAECRRFILQRAKELDYRNAEDFLTGILNKKLSGVLLKLAGISGQMPVREVKKADFERLIGLLKSFEAPVTATNSFEQAQVCCGGVDTRQIDARTMESTLVPGLYLIGELLDVDGICGGYNLQWAWTTGVLAGTQAGNAGVQTGRTGIQTGKTEAQTGRIGRRTVNIEVQTERMTAQTVNTGAQTERTTARVENAGVQTAKTAKRVGKTATQARKAATQTGKMVTQTGKAGARTRKTAAQAGRTGI